MKKEGRCSYDDEEEDIAVKGYTELEEEYLELFDEEYNYDEESDYFLNAIK